MRDELHWRPKSEDPAFREGYDFVERNKETANGFVEPAVVAASAVANTALCGQTPTATPKPTVTPRPTAAPTVTPTGAGVRRVHLPLLLKEAAAMN